MAKIGGAGSRACSGFGGSTPTPRGGRCSLSGGGWRTCPCGRPTTRSGSSHSRRHGWSSTSGPRCTFFGWCGSGGSCASSAVAATPRGPSPFGGRWTSVCGSCPSGCGSGRSGSTRGCRCGGGCTSLACGRPGWSRLTCTRSGRTASSCWARWGGRRYWSTCCTGSVTSSGGCGSISGWGTCPAAPLRATSGSSCSFDPYFLAYRWCSGSSEGITSTDTLR